MGMTASVVESVANAAGRDESNLLNGLVAWWSFEEAGGPRFDRHGERFNRRGLRLTDNNTVISAGGKAGMAAEFQRIDNEYLSCENTGLLNQRGDFTWSCLVMPYTEMDHVLVSKGGQYEAGLQDGMWYFRYFARSRRNKPLPLLCLGGKGKTAEWQRITVLRSRNRLRIYSDLDSKEMAVNNPAFSGIGAPLIVGYGLSGRLDELAFWNRALTPDDIDELANNPGYPE